MSFLLDTCVLSEFQKPKPRRSVIAWLRECEEELFFLSALTLGELQRGISKLRRSRKRARLQEWLDGDLRTRFQGRILGIDERVALRWGVVQAVGESRGQRVPVIDGLIACTALAHDLAVVTRNARDFEPTGVEVVDPWAL